MTFKDSAEQLGEEFVQNPINFVTEADLQVRLVELLRSTLSQTRSTVSNPILADTQSSYKEAYWKAVQQGMKDAGQIDRVHTEVSVQQGERLDVAVFAEEISNQIQWVSSGSKRFSHQDIDAVFELKYVKNKYKFPTETGVKIADLVDTDYDIDELESYLDFDENNIGPDAHELNRLADVEHRFLLLFSNNNYLFDGPLSEPELDYKNGDLYSDLGEAAIRWIRQELDSDIGFLYAHPRGKKWM